MIEIKPEKGVILSLLTLIILLAVIISCKNPQHTGDTFAKDGVEVYQEPKIIKNTQFTSTQLKKCDSLRQKPN